MKYCISIPSLLLLLFVMATPSQAQKKRLKEVANEYSMAYREVSEEDRDKRRKVDLSKVKYEIDQVSEHAETKDLAATYGWKSVVYTSIATEEDSLLRKQLDPQGKAATIAGEAMTKFYTFPKSEQDYLEAGVFVNDFLPNTIISLYNKAIVLVNQKGNFQAVKHNMEMVETLIAYDKDEKAQDNSVSKEKALVAIATSAATDSLVDMEIQYLDKLIAMPRYFNADVFVRMSQIYSSRKQYDKALEYLAKGQQKIPQQKSVFLEQEINIEIERDNISVLLTKFNEAIKEDPENKDYYYSRGVCFHQLKRNEKKEMGKAGSTQTKPNFFYIQGLNDYAKALSLDPSYTDARVNEALLLKDSAEYLYSMRKVDYANYDKPMKEVYKQVLAKMESVRESNAVQGLELLQWLDEMIKICKRISDDAGKEKYMTLKLTEEEKLRR